MIGAVVGVQPFGGEGLSGTGPKAGGPHYLYRFCAEQTLTINTAAAGGNAALLAGGAERSLHGRLRKLHRWARLAFIGGGNMASAIIGGLVASGQRRRRSWWSSRSDGAARAPARRASA